MGKLLLIALVLIGFWFFFFAEAPSKPEVAASSLTGRSSTVAQEPTVRAEDRIVALAERERLNVLFGSREGNNLHVRIEWGGNQATRGGDFLMVLLREGVIADFDQEGKGRLRHDEQGARVWSQDFVLKLKAGPSSAR